MSEWATPSRSLRRAAGRAIRDFDMIRTGDRVLVAVSGGKDSLSLLHLLRYLQRRAPVRFELAAMTVDPQSDSFDPSVLKPYMEALELPFHYVSQPILAQAMDHMEGNSYCAWCARMKRGVMYTTCRQHGYNVLALGQHLDDLAESFLMSAFHGGRLQTMKAHYTNDEGDVRIIRPLAYVRERQTAAFAAYSGLPVVAENCPACFSMPTQRMHMKELLAREERENPNLLSSMLAAMRPLMYGVDVHGERRPMGRAKRRRVRAES